MSTIPLDIWLEILKRVPVETTFVCKCVCKFMCDVISQTYFVKMHLHHSIEKSNQKFLQRTFVESRSEMVGFSTSRKIVSVSHDSVLSTRRTPEYTILSDVPFQYSDYDVFLIDSCNGLVCLLYRGVSFQYFFCLWNPATTEYMKIPKLESLNLGKTFDIRTSVIGYDSKTDNYKWVISARLCGANFGSSFHVFRLREKSWGTQTIPYCLSASKSAIFLNGAFHWLCEMRGQATPSILSWDINKEEFKEVQLPDMTLKNGVAVKDIGVLEKCMCVVVHVPTFCVEVWLMQVHGSRDSWCRRYIVVDEIIVSPPQFRSLGDMYSYPLRMTRSFKSGEILFWFPGKGLLYDPTHETDERVRELSMDSHLLTRGLHSYMETLVSLNSGHYVVNRGKSMNTKQMKRKSDG